MTTMRNERVLVTILTGFLGSGKTTLLNRLLRHSRFSDTAVIVNELGEVGLDHLLVEQAVDQMVLLQNGCVCCSVRGDLVDTLEALTRKVAIGAIPAFRHVVIETTGLADPAPVVHMLIDDATVAGRFVLGTVVTTVDGVTGVSTLQSFAEARSQVAMADLLLVTKGDMAEASVPEVSGAAAALNPHAAVLVASSRDLEADVVLRHLDAADIDPGRHTGAADAADTGSLGGPDHAHAKTGAGIHTWDISTVSLFPQAALPWRVLRDWLEWLTAMRGPDVLRIKGLVAVEGFAGPVLVHGVQHVFHPPLELAEWPGGDRRSRIVIIARDIPKAALQRSFEMFVSGSV